MSEPRVHFDSVWKKFRRGVKHDSLRDLVPAAARSLFGRQAPRRSLARDEFWALRDVSFEVAPGSALGIIGPNGAGKSTVLKLLIGILRPNRGMARIEGRTGALIEIAAGFHQDLTGRENVYLQGAIMGMKRAEIARQFDRIVEFAELAEFIDTQVKRYSSGMNARLGFAIAAHLDPEVLIIDEVLAVGDRAFQRKAFDRLAEIARRSIPVVIVSHQLDRVAALCSEAILLDRGRVVMTGTAADCIARYVSSGIGEQVHGGAPGAVRLERLRIEPDVPVRPGDPLRLLIDADARAPLPDAQTLTIRVRRVSTGEALFSVTTRAAAQPLPSVGRFQLALELHAHLAGGMYLVEVCISDVHTQLDLSASLRSTFRVREDHLFHGPVDLDARFAPPAARSHA
jgi:ABC-type polysaccharide/polyol phosphate transport system ATPase subunit